MVVRHFCNPQDGQAGGYANFKCREESCSKHWDQRQDCPPVALADIHLSFVYVCYVSLCAFGLLFVIFNVLGWFIQKLRPGWFIHENVTGYPKELLVGAFQRRYSLQETAISPHRFGKPMNRLVCL